MNGNHDTLSPPSTSTASSANLNRRCNPSAIPKSLIGIRSTNEVSCSTCANVSADVIWHKMVSDFSWCISLRCCLCKRSWLICTDCDFNLRLPKFTDFRKVQRHCNAYHSSTNTHIQQTSCSAQILHDDTTTDDFGFSEPEIISEQHNKFSTTIESSTSHDTLSSYEMSNILGSATSSYYFSAKLSLGKFSGAKRLIMNSQFGCASSLHNISSTDIDRQLLLTEFIYSLKKDQ
jgi:hypothetical protein